MPSSGDRLSLYRSSHVLVAHGQLTMRRGLTGLLDRAGYVVDAVGDCADALAVVDMGDIDAVVVSLRLPPEGCFLLFDACDEPPPAVVLNGDAEDIVGLAVDPRVSSVLTRPFPRDELLEAVATAVERRRTT